LQHELRYFGENSRKCPCQRQSAAKDLKEYADEYFFKPFEMTQTGFIDHERDIYTQTIPGYTIESGQLVDETTRNKTWGPCGIIGTPEDMVKWNGRCPQELFDKLAESPVPLQPEAFSYGRGINVGYFDNGRYKIMVHSGGIEGFMTRYFKVIDNQDPERSFGLFISSNLNKFVPEFFDNFTASLVNIWIGKNVIPMVSESPSEPEISMPLSITADMAESLSGVYSVPGWTHQARIEPKSLGENSLGIRFMPDSEKKDPGIDFSISPEDATVFKSIDPPTAKLQFNKQGLIFTDLSKNVTGIQFKRIQS
jgi:hypothetical protein